MYSSRKDELRRKCFAVFLAVVILVYIAELLGISLVPGERELVGISGESHVFVCDVVSVKPTDEKAALTLKIKSADGNAVSYPGRILVNLYFEGTKYSRSDSYVFLNRRIEFAAKLTVPRGERNPHCFNYRRYLMSRKIFLTGTLKSFEFHEKTIDLYSKIECYLFRERCLFEDGLSEDVRGVTMGLLFGDTSALSENAYDDFRTNGTAHVLAVSGLHVGILYAVFRKLTKDKLNMITLAALGFILLCYGTLALWSPSVTRAIVMIAMSVLAKLLDLRYDMLTAMSSVGLVLILINPYVVFGASFQMSFLAISSMAFVLPVLPKKIPENIRTVLAVNLGLIGYQVYNYNYVSLTFIIANIAIVFLAGYLVPILIGWFALFLAFGRIAVIARACELMTRAFLAVNSLSAMGGRGSFDCVSPPYFLVFFGTTMLFLCCSEAMYVKRERHQYRDIAKIIAFALALSLVFTAMNYRPVSRDDVIFADVGQGDCVHIKVDNVNLLIDGGGSVTYNVGKNTLKPYLLKNGAKSLDCAVLTHTHTDHYKGITELAECCRVERILTDLRAGDVIEASDDVRIECIWPLADFNGSADSNANCSVYIIYFKNYKIMVTGDLDSEGERGIINYYKARGADLRCDVLKVGHHGSKTSTSADFLEAVSPKYAVIQVGVNNYGHPAPETLERLEAQGATVLRNDLNGAVGFRFSDGEIKYHTMIR